MNEKKTFLLEDIAPNYFRHCYIGDFKRKSLIEILMVNFAQMFNKSTLDAILLNRCLRLAFFILLFFSFRL